MQRQLISQLSPVLESKSVFVSERGLTSTQWSEYSENTKRIQYSAVLTSDITAEAVTVHGFVLSQKDTAGVVTTTTRSYTASGMLLTQTEGRGNTTSTITDTAGCPLVVTDAPSSGQSSGGAAADGHSTTSAYCDCCDHPALVTDAMDNIKAPQSLRR